MYYLHGVNNFELLNNRIYATTGENSGLFNYSIIILILNIIHVIITMADSKVSFQTYYLYTQKPQKYFTGITTFSLTLIKIKISH